jgi:hypothetical protein
LGGKVQFDHKHAHDARTQTQTHRTQEELAVLERSSSDLWSRDNPLDAPHDPRLKLTTLLVPKCRAMIAKRMQMWLVFESSTAGAEVTFVFKVRLFVCSFVCLFVRCRCLFGCACFEM